MAKVEKSIIIHADPESINRFALDPHTYPQWFEGVESVESDGVYPEVGGKVNLQYKSLGVTFTLVMTSREFQRGSTLTNEMDGMITGVQAWKLVPEGNGTRVSVNFNYDVPGGGLGKILDKLMLERVNAENLEKSLENLKRVVESA